MSRSWQEITVTVEIGNNRRPRQVQIGADAPATFIAIAENGAAGRDIGLISTSDLDTTQTHTYSLVDTNGNPHTASLFAIVETAEGSGVFKLKLHDGVTLNREEHNGGIYVIRIKTTISGDPAKSFIQDIGIDITNIIESYESKCSGLETSSPLISRRTRRQSPISAGSRCKEAIRDFILSR